MLCCCSKANNTRITDAELLRQHLFEEFYDIFKSQPLIKDEQFNIVLKENAVLCCFARARPIPTVYQQALRYELDKLLREDIITSVTEATEWVNPIVVEPKRDRNGQYNGKIRLSVDFRHLNKYCVRERYQSPNVLEVVQNIQADHASLFSTSDAWKGYHRIELAQEIKNFTTFLPPFGGFAMNAHRLASTLSVSITIAEGLKNYTDYLTLLKWLTIALCTQLMTWQPTLPLFGNF